MSKQTCVWSYLELWLVSVKQPISNPSLTLQYLESREAFLYHLIKLPDASFWVFRAQE